MPLDGANVASKPAGTTAVPNTTVASTPYNLVVDDIYQILNRKPTQTVAGSMGLGVIPTGLLDNGKGLALGDNDSGIRQNGDGVIEIIQNGSVAMNFAAVKADSGYVKLPIGLVLQWGVYNSGAAAGSISYTVPFVTRTASLTAGVIANSAGNVYGIQLNNIDANGFGFRKTFSNGSSVGNSGESFYWMAIGY